MKILFVTSSPLEANTSAMISNIALLDGFKSLGNEVTFISFRSYSETHQNQEYFEGVKLIRLEPNQLYGKLIRKDNKSYLKKEIKKNILKYTRMVYHRISLFDNYKKAIDNLEDFKLNESYDLMISCSDPKSSHLLGLKIYNENKSKIKSWVQHWGDPMAIDISRKSKLPMKFVARQEKKILEKADHIVYVSPFTSEKQIELFPSLKDKISFIPLAYRNEKNYKLSNLQKKDKITFGYYGSSNSKIRDILPLYKAFVNVTNETLKIIGDTDLNLLDSDNIKVQNQRISSKEIEIEESNTDILIVLGNKIGTQIPGKIFYYAGTNKPILVILERTQKELWKYLDSLNRFIICENNECAIKEKILNIRNEISEKQLQPLEDFKPSKVAMSIISLLVNR